MKGYFYSLCSSRKDLSQILGDLPDNCLLSLKKKTFLSHTELFVEYESPVYFNQNLFIFLFYFRLVLSDEEVNLGSEPGKMVDSIKCEMITYKRENSLLQPFQRDCINIHLIKKR